MDNLNAEVTTVEKREGKNIIQQLLNFTTQLTSKMDGEGNLKNKSQDEINDLMSSINDLEYDLVYFKDEMDDKQSEISKIGFQLEVIRNLSLDTGKRLENAESPEEKYRIKDVYLKETMSALEVIDKSVTDALKEERDIRRKDAIKDIFIDTQVKIKDAISELKLIQGNLGEQSEGIRNGLEGFSDSVSKQLTIIESHTSDIRENSQRMKESQDAVEKLIKDWGVNSQAKIDEELKKMMDDVKNQKQEKEENIKSEINQLEKVGKDAFESLEELAERSESMLKGEVFKQVLVYLGSAFGFINFVILLLMFFLKK